MKKKTEDLFKMTIEDSKDTEKYIQKFSAFLSLAVCIINPLGISLILIKLSKS